jgi:hypothetical protein
MKKPLRPEGAEVYLLMLFVSAPLWPVLMQLS